MVIALIFREDFKIPLNEVWKVVKAEPGKSNKIHCVHCVSQLAWGGGGVGGLGLSAFSDAE